MSPFLVYIWIEDDFRDFATRDDTPRTYRRRAETYDLVDLKNSVGFESNSLRPSPHLIDRLDREGGRYMCDSNLTFNYVDIELVSSSFWSR
jgi:hypothetical protein